MTRTLDIVTPEHVAIRYELAGFGSRAVAAMADTLLQILIIMLLPSLAWLLAYLLIPTRTDAIIGSLVKMGGDWEETGASILWGLVILGTFLIFWGYYVAFETLWNGETPGKRWLGLRVIKDGGYPVDFRAVLIRNLLRAADCLPGVPIVPSYGLGFVCMLVHPQYKRLGDLAAGTLVVRHGQAETTARLPGLGEAQVYRLLDTGVISQLSRLTREEYRMIQRFLDRRRELPQPLRGEFAQRLAAPLIEKFAYQPPILGMDPERWLEELDLAYRNRALGTPAAPMPTSATPLPTPVVPDAPSDGRKW